MQRNGKRNNDFYDIRIRRAKCILPVFCFPNKLLHLSTSLKEQRICPLADGHTLPSQCGLPETNAKKRKKENLKNLRHK